MGGIPIKSFKQFTIDMALGKKYCGNPSQNPTIEEYSCGLLVRIAEALEKIAQGPTIFQERQRADDYRREALERWNQIQDFRREIKRLKKELKLRDLEAAKRAARKS